MTFEELKRTHLADIEVLLIEQYYSLLIISDADKLRQVEEMISHTEILQRFISYATTAPTIKIVFDIYEEKIRAIN